MLCSSVFLPVRDSLRSDGQRATLVLTVRYRVSHHSLMLKLFPIGAPSARIVLPTASHSRTTSVGALFRSLPLQLPLVLGGAQLVQWRRCLCRPLRARGDGRVEDGRGDDESGAGEEGWAEGEVEGGDEERDDRRDDDRERRSEAYATRAAARPVAAPLPPPQDGGAPLTTLSAYFITSATSSPPSETWGRSARGGAEM